jgi:hypothetical protein
MEGFEQAMGQGAAAGPPSPAPQGAPQAPQGAPQGGQAPQNGVPATPEQQAQYNRFFAYSILMLYNEDFMPKVQELFQKTPTPIEAAARVGAAIATRIYTAALDKGAEIPTEVMLYAGQEVMGEIAEMARMAGLANLSPEDVETAYYMAADMVRHALEGAGKIGDIDGKQELDQIRGMIGDDRMGQVVDRMGQVQKQTIASMQGGGQQGRAVQ